jgi:hypothetical protein
MTTTKYSMLKIIVREITFSRQLGNYSNHGKLEFEIDFADSPARTFFHKCLLFPCADSCVRYLVRKKNKYIPKELREQWERDCAKKLNVNPCVSWSGPQMLWIYSGLGRAAKGQQKEKGTQG